METALLWAVVAVTGAGGEGVEKLFPFEADLQTPGAQGSRRGRAGRASSTTAGIAVTVPAVVAARRAARLVAMICSIGSCFVAGSRARRSRIGRPACCRYQPRSTGVWCP